MRSLSTCILFTLFVALPVYAQDSGTKALRTPDDRFENLPDFPYEPHYHEHNGLRTHYVDEGPRDGQPVLLLHGEPSWSYLYRKMIPPIVEAGHRVIAPDLIGFGRSDKLPNRSDYTHSLLVEHVAALIESLDLQGITVFCQDWGGLVGLRLAAEHEPRFARIIAANTGLPAGPGEGQILGAEFTEPDPNAELTENTNFMAWVRFSQTVPDFRAGSIVQAATATMMPPEVVAAYDAPFPDDTYKAGARVLPTLVLSELPKNRAAMDVLRKWEKPFLTLFSDGDPITRGGEKFFQTQIPGVKGQPHQIIEGAGHFLQEDKGELLGKLTAEFIASTK